MESLVKKLQQSMRSGSSRKRKEKDGQEEERRFLHNGSIFLKELIADCNGKSIPIRTFSSEQIQKATNNFDRTCFVTEEEDHEWYKGIIEDKPYLIKKFYGDRDTEGNEVLLTRRWVGKGSYKYNDIVLAARMSNHNNFLKLFGCCFEFFFLVFVFENAENGYLNERGYFMVNGEESSLPWSVRLKIGKEIANALTYLHMAFPKIIIHRHIKPTIIFLDKNWNVKLSDFSLSITLPEGKSRIQVDRVLGTFGYLDPLHQATGFVTEYTDVYSFGICLLVFVTGRPVVFTTSYGDSQGILGYVRELCEDGKLDEVIDPMVAKDMTCCQRLQVEACVVLALRCCKKRDEDRPKMIQVAKELKRIQTSWKDPCYQVILPTHLYGEASNYPLCFFTAKAKFVDHLEETLSSDKNHLDETLSSDINHLDETLSSDKNLLYETQSEDKDHLYETQSSYQKEISHGR
ncbi:unnamed protein product [Arabidopsis halleri]